MLGNPFRSNEYSAMHAGTATAVGSKNARTQSGIYSRSSTRPVAVALSDPLPDAGSDDELDQVTSVYHEKPSDPSVRAEAPPRPMQIPNPVWHVAMVLQDDELTRLWARNARALGGRTFVWSEFANSWITLQGPPQRSLGVAQEPMRPIVQQAPSSAERSARNAPASSTAYPRRRRDLAPPVDLTAQARLVIPPMVPTRYAPSLVAALLVLVGTTVAWSHRASPEVATETAQATTEDARKLSSVKQRPAPGSEEAMGTKPVARLQGNRAIGPDLAPVQVSSVMQSVPAESLPLVEATERITPRKSAERTSKTVSLATLPRLPFEPASALRALEGAIGRSRHCATGQVSGTVYVTFEPSGNAKHITLGSIAGDTARAQCLLDAFYAVKVPPFGGDSVVVKKSFQING